MTWVKICGTTNLDDAMLAVDAGADALGFVLAPSKRRVSPEKVAEIVQHLPRNIEKIGVFLNESSETILEIVRQTGLTGVQLHGNESPEVARQVAASSAVRVLKGIHAGPALEADLSAWSREKAIGALLLDSGNGTQGGGTGKTFDWSQAAAAIRVAHVHARVIVAGGLNPENVVRAIETFRPWGVDVASGVETEPGKKDRKRVMDFVAAVRGAQN